LGLSSESVEEYLEAIYSINEKGRQAKNQDLSEKLKVSPPSVTQMIQRLAEEGLVEYEPYKGAALTGKGMALAQKVVRKHRLLERFLYDYLKLPFEKVHDEACRMEHSISDETTMALCKALDNPEKCPDDLPIPVCIHEVDDCAQCASVREKLEQEHPLTTQLSNLKPGETGQVAFIRSGKQSGKRIQDMGLTPGTFIKMVNAAPFKGPVEVEVRGTSVALGRQLAGQVYINVEDEGKPWKRAHPHGPHHGSIKNT
jgi:DtxR family Mn-dependent transcriptional regulator